MAHPFVLLGITAVQIVGGIGMFAVIVDDEKRFHKWLKPLMLAFVSLDLIALYLVVGMLPSGYFP
jgi:hypothetical protein